ncbi:MAG: hypothetical protein WDN24_07025 [Sphingomonas sp.]
MLLAAAALLLAQTAACPPVVDTTRLGAFAAWAVHGESLEPGTAVTLLTGDPARITGLAGQHPRGQGSDGSLLDRRRRPL